MAVFLMAIFRDSDFFRIFAPEYAPVSGCRRHPLRVGKVWMRQEYQALNHHDDDLSEYKYQ